MTFCEPVLTSTSTAPEIVTGVPTRLTRPAIRPATEAPRERKAVPSVIRTPAVLLPIDNVRLVMTSWLVTGGAVATPPATPTTCEKSRTPERLCPNRLRVAGASAVPTWTTTERGARVTPPTVATALVLLSWRLAGEVSAKASPASSTSSPSSTATTPVAARSIKPLAARLAIPSPKVSLRAS